jgi:integrase
MAKIKLPPYLQIRRRLYYVSLDIPKDVRTKFAGKPRFVRSLETDSLAVAERRKWHYIDQWRSQISSARGGGDLIAEIRALEDSVKDDPLHHYELKSYHHSIAVDHLVDTGDDSLLTAVKVAHGDWVLLEEHLPAWLKRKTEIDEVNQKTLESYQSIIERFLKRFRYLHEVEPEKVLAWLQEQNLTVRTMKVRLTALRGFLVIAGAPKTILQDILDVGDLPKSQRKKRRIEEPRHYEDPELLQLYNAAIDKGDAPLADLIKLACFTGCRIEELCSLKCEMVTDNALMIRNAKTDAGDRDVPIHRSIRQLVTRLMDQSTDGYLLSGLTFNKYGDRSNAIGKRFGKMKSKLGYDDRTVFHSFRRTFITKLERAGVQESSIARLVGHRISEKRSMSLGLYSGGLSLTELTKIIEKVEYQGMK